MCRLLDWSLGTASITDAGGVMDISRWCEPPVPITKCGEPRQGRRNGRRAISAAPAGARIQSSRRTGGLHHRLMSNVPSGLVGLFRQLQSAGDQFLKPRIGANRVPFPAEFQIVDCDAVIDAVDRAWSF